MHYLDISLPTIEQNLALDEALLDEADNGRAGTELLRIWKVSEFFVVVGRSSKVDVEVDRAQTAKRSMPIFRRVSGGASVLAGPGCMFYSLLLSLELRPHLRMLDEAHRFVMTRMVSGLQPLIANIKFDGTCDLVVEEKKVSGNSMRLVRNWILYHGTLLLDFDLELLDQCLRHPPREPEYRRGRKHSEFVTNVHVPFEAVAGALRMAWQAIEVRHTIPERTLNRLVREKYAQSSWNFLR